MPRPFLEKIKTGEYWAEQAAHGWMGYTAAFPTGCLVYGLTGSGKWAFVAGIVAAALLAILYELIQNLGDDDNDIADSVLDALMIATGGTLTGLPWLVVWLWARA